MQFRANNPILEIYFLFSSKTESSSRFTVLFIFVSSDYSATCWIFCQFHLCSCPDYLFTCLLNPFRVSTLTFYILHLSSASIAFRSRDIRNILWLFIIFKVLNDPAPLTENFRLIRSSFRRSDSEFQNLHFEIFEDCC